MSIYYNKVGTDITIANTPEAAGAHNIWSGTSALCSGYYVTIAGSTLVLPESATRLFYGAKSVSGLDKVDASGCTNMNYMFERCGETTYDIDSWDVSNVTSMKSIFSGCSARYIYVSTWDISNVTDLSSAFNGITNMYLLDLLSWKPGAALQSGGLNYMFNGCTELRYIKVEDGDDWKLSTSGVTGTDMFTGCTHLPNFTDGEVDINRANTIKNFGYFTGTRVLRPCKVYMRGV